jgi:hypothetical protein
MWKSLSKESMEHIEAHAWVSRHWSLGWLEHDSNELHPATRIGCTIEMVQASTLEFNEWVILSVDRPS